MPLPTLDVAVAAYGAEGIAGVERMLLPPAEGVRYVVSWQSHEGTDTPAALLRGDVLLLRLDGVGLSRNRNNALRRCDADIVLFADDDLEYFPESFTRVREAFASRPDADVILFRFAGNSRKRYPEEPCPVGLPFPKGYWVSSIETAVRRESVGYLSFDEEMGLGAPFFTAGEDEMFVISAIKRGLRCWFENVEICRHDGESTGIRTDIADGTLRASGRIISIIYPRTVIPRILLKALRVSRRGKTAFPRALRLLLQGAAAK
ncbi:MAG: glycosyltransferase [Bacteroidales bacterium]|nr:glycosyltransferase [Bacteroidales bacterium]